MQSIAELEQEVCPATRTLVTLSNFTAQLDIIRVINEQMSVKIVI